MLVMAIEGVRQLHSKSVSRISAFQLRDIVFPGSLVVSPNANTIETQLTLQPSTAKEDQELALGYYFRVFGLSNDTFLELCHGNIEIESNTSSASTSFVEFEVRRLGVDFSKPEDVGNRWETASSSQFYESIGEYGYHLGPAFQNLTQMRSTAEGEATSTLILDQWNSHNAKYPPMSHLIHPIDLDAVFQSSVRLYSQGGRVPMPILVPTRVASIWISNDLVDREGQTRLSLATNISFSGLREADFSIAATDDKGSVEILVEGFRQTFLVSQILHDLIDSEPRRSCYHLVWKADPDLLPSRDVLEYCNSKVDPASVFPGEQVDQLEFVCLYYMSEALKKVPRSRIPKDSPHLHKYMDWVEHRFDSEELKRYLCLDQRYEELLGSDAERESFLARFEEESAVGKLIAQTCLNLLPILRGERDALDLLFSSDLASEFYASSFFTASFERPRSYVDLLAHKNPAMNILEVGAGTGSATSKIIDLLTDYSGREDDRADIPRFEKYTFTDISPAFFEKAKERFASLGSMMSFTVLNIGEHPHTQGLSGGEYDLIVCSLVLHATSDLRKTLRHIRMLLKPQGKLLFFEPSAPERVRVPFVFGLLPGWWLSVEKEREWSPLLDVSGWDSMLRETGFDGIQVDLPDNEEPSRVTFNLFLSNATKMNDNLPTVTVAVVVSNDNALQQQMAHQLSSLLSNEGRKTSIISVETWSLEPSRQNQYVFLVDVGSAFFSNISATPWDAFKTLADTCYDVLWVTQPAGADAYALSSSIVTGIGRAIRSENLDSRFVQLHLQNRASIEDATSRIHSVLTRPHEPLTDVMESEFAEVDKQLSIGRLVEGPTFDLSTRNLTSLHHPKADIFHTNTRRPLNLSIGSPGLLGTLRFEDDPDYDLPLQASEVEIRVRAAGINSKDVLIALGQVSGHRLGFECAGQVTRAGIDSGFAPGDRVCGAVLAGAYKLGQGRMHLP